MTTEFQPPFSNLQVEWLRVFSMNLSEKDLQAISRLMAKYLLEKARKRRDEIEVGESHELSEEELTRLTMHLSEQSPAEVWENEEDEIWNNI